MYFEKFLSNMKSMFTKFEDNYELLTEAQKTQLLFQKFQIPRLTQVKNALHVSYNLYQEKAVTFDFVANNMEAEAANLPENVLNRQSSGVDTQGERG